MSAPTPIQSAPAPTPTPTPTMSLSTKPTWLFSILADMEERMKMLACNKNTGPEQDTIGGDTFAERAEAYYRTRPQLLSLLQDLYNAYLTLSDRYIQTIAKTTHRPGHSPQISIIDNDYYDFHDDQQSQEDADSDFVDSSLSYQQSILPPAAQDDTTTNTMWLNQNQNHNHNHNHNQINFDAIVTEIVMKNVECDILLDEANSAERRYNESSRKIELQKSLLEVLESERLILLNENAKLGYKVGALVEDNKTLASESIFMRRKAGELAGCLLKMRENQRVCMLSRKIEDLQAQIYALEKRNKEYSDQQSCTINKHKNKNKNGNEVDFKVCFQIGKINHPRLKRGTNGNKGSSWWKRVKNMDLFLCGHNLPSST